MKSTVEFPPLTPREYMAFLCARFGKGYVARKFGVCERTVERWMAVERYVGEEGVRKGPVEKYEETLQDCLDRGHNMEARAMVARHAKLVGCELMECEAIPHEKSDWRDQLLEDLRAFSRFEEAVRLFVEEELDDLELMHQCDALVREVRKTVNCVKRRLKFEMQILREHQHPYVPWNREAPGGGNDHRDMAQVPGMRAPVGLRQEDSCPRCGATVQEKALKCPCCGGCVRCQ